MIDKVREAYFKGKPVLTDSQLLEELFKKIEKKSVGTNIRKIAEGKIASKYQYLKTMSSLLTHIFIECEQNNTEYMLLVESTLNKIYEHL